MYRHYFDYLTDSFSIVMGCCPCKVALFTTPYLIPIIVMPTIIVDCSTIHIKKSLDPRSYFIDLYCIKAKSSFRAHLA